ncbi:MAG: hypothetical protein JWM31_1226, partial [Solirubrobacterales bacterium]|nr:hypothetical protein [Solirubrobacterales bacterium]
MDPRKLRLGVAVLAALGAAEVAVHLLAPHDGALTPRSVDLEAYFSRATLHRLRDYADGQLWLSLLGLVLPALVLGWLVRRPPRVLDDPGDRRPLLR